ncbi:uncharacterized protein LOC110678179 [Aedes aegypti]|uniref:Uncharacterized protein n=1 Tax=Aedes aegypti TaxID=7159 RepID=A0A6I8TZJ4_AEDAE|nr:uncharacterized protein LOC110678179 [Aedes aegypti]
MALRERSKLMSVTVDAIRTIETFVDEYDAEIDRNKIESRLMRLDQLYDRYVNVSIEVEMLMEEKTETKDKFFKSPHTAAVSKTYTPKATSCIVCNQSHRIYDCEVFKRMQLEQKQDTVRKKKLCWNCLSPSHLSRECSSKPCRRCNEKHHTLLHPPSPNDRSTQPQAKPPIRTQQSTSSIDDESVIPALLSVPAPLASTTTTSATQQPHTSNALAAANSTKTSYSTVLLSTAVVKVHGPSGRSTFVRTLLDSCSESNFITERIVQLLGLNRQKQAAVIAGMGGSTINSNRCTVTTFSSVDSTYSNTLTFNILTKITNDLPERKIDVSNWHIPSTVVLADPDFAKPQRIDMVIGAQLFFSLLREGQLPVVAGSPISQPILQRTVFGWVVSSPIKTHDQSRGSERVTLLCTTEDLDKQLPRFWRVGSSPNSRGLRRRKQPAIGTYQHPPPVTNQAGSLCAHQRRKKEFGTTSLVWRPGGSYLARY